MWLWDGKKGEGRERRISKESEMKSFLGGIFNYAVGRSCRPLAKSRDTEKVITVRGSHCTKAARTKRSKDNAANNIYRSHLLQILSSRRDWCTTYIWKKKWRTDLGSLQAKDPNGRENNPTLRYCGRIDWPLHIPGGEALPQPLWLMAGGDPAGGSLVDGWWESRRIQRASSIWS